MSYPRMEVDLKALAGNACRLKAVCDSAGIGVYAVTKVFCAMPEVAAVFKEAGFDALADSRILNLQRLEPLNMRRVLLRLPMMSEVEEVVRHADVSLNSELSVVQRLSEAATDLGKRHGVLLMIDLGDLREGVRPEEAEALAERIERLEGVELEGIGTNLTCYGAVIPDERNMGLLTETAETIEERIGRRLRVVSGGNSSSLPLLLNGGLPKRINNLRLGEALVLGRETAYGRKLEGLRDDVFILVAELVEVREKPTVPTGTIGMDAFGNRPVYEDRGIRKRGILAVGKQDVSIEGLRPLDGRIEIFGASSDHMIVDLTDAGDRYRVGDVLRFKLDYGALMKLSTSEYVKKVII